jgi:hypothetical protein
VAAFGMVCRMWRGGTSVLHANTSQKIYIRKPKTLEIKNIISGMILEGD